MVLRPDFVLLLDLLSVDTSCDSLAGSVGLVCFHAGFLGLWEMMSTDVSLLSKTICFL